MPQRDGLKSIDDLLKVDERNLYFVKINPKTGEQRSPTLQDHHADIAQFNLENCVPEDVATQYDIARNLYQYAWFEYRFYNVAEAHVLTTLELALKKRIGEELKRYISERKRKHKEETGKKSGIQRGLKTLMEYCRDHNLVRNEGFRQWHIYPTCQAFLMKEYNATKKAKKEIQRTEASTVTQAELEQEELPPDPNYDHVQHLIDHTNKFRNGYAHGSTNLYKNVLESFEMVSEFINQIYASDKGEDDCTD